MWEIRTAELLGYWRNCTRLNGTREFKLKEVHIHLLSRHCNGRERGDRSRWKLSNEVIHANIHGEEKWSLTIAVIQQTGNQSLIDKHKTKSDFDGLRPWDLNWQIIFNSEQLRAENAAVKPLKWWACTAHWSTLSMKTKTIESTVGGYLRMFD